ncbi:Minor histocompatibility antigen H13 [Hypsizygus marmoreus]|uniref:Minor histocompatibility antigen H13 n=1 Tax=Hypsizygus marmoreus TaxID=39966 RepID=A0A369J952_HYPMA|nr:Minor histocompatibility antigen H13 [Hypsizygus marmoreus]
MAAGGTDWDLLSSYVGLIALACSSVYVGAYGSLPNPKRAAGAPVDEDDEEELPERMSSGDAYLFPVVGSVALVGLYAIVHYFGKEWINWALGWYFSIAGVGSVWKSSISLTRYLLGSTRWKQFDKTVVSVKKGHESLLYLSWRTPSLFLFPLAVIPSAVYSFSTSSRKSVLITDLLSLSFSHNALSLLKLDTFQTGSILLSGLFFYDIWWVFGTEVMVKVATTLDIPIKLLWPKSLMFSDARGFTMLGLGDVVIPGTFVALALRYDYYRSLKAKSPSRGSFAKPYFYAALAAYASGLAGAMSIMHLFGKAQPALLYLSPACILSFFITAAVRGELREGWNWSDEPEDFPIEEEKKAI